MSSVRVSEISRIERPNRPIEAGSLFCLRVHQRQKAVFPETKSLHAELAEVMIGM